jgi:hypothetical protein
MSEDRNVTAEGRAASFARTTVARQTRAQFSKSQQRDRNKGSPEPDAAWSKHDKQECRDAKAGKDSTNVDRGQHCFNYRVWRLA